MHSVEGDHGRARPGANGGFTGGRESSPKTLSDGSQIRLILCPGIFSGTEGRSGLESAVYATLTRPRLPAGFRDGPADRRFSMERQSFEQISSPFGGFRQGNLDPQPGCPLQAQRNLSDNLVGRPSHSCGEPGLRLRGGGTGPPGAPPHLDSASSGARIPARAGEPIPA